MNGAPVLVAHRDRVTCDLVRCALEEAGFPTLVGGLSGDLLDRVERCGVSLAVVDARLAVARSDQLLDWLQVERVPIVCSASTGATDPAEILERGADDVVREPFSPRELVARVKAVLRGYARSRAPREVIALGPILVDRGGRFASVRGRRLALTRSELEILGRLVASPGRVFTRDELLAVVLAAGKRTTPRLIDTHLVSLRRKLGAAGEWIETVRGYGYRARVER